VLDKEGSKAAKAARIDPVAVEVDLSTLAA
jgi:hypothetical protein